MSSNPSHSSASAIAIQSTVVSTGHGDCSASTGAEKNPVAAYPAVPARAAAIQSTVVSTGHGDARAGTGAKKNAVLIGAADPARAAAITKCSHRGIDWGHCGELRILVSMVGRTPQLRASGNHRNYPS